VEFEPEEIATLIAALAHYKWHGCGEPDARNAVIHKMATAGDQLVSLDDEGIDALAIKLEGGLK